MLRAALLATLLLAFLPLPASAIRDFPPDEVGGDVGPCHASQTFMVDNSFTTAYCVVHGHEVFYHRSGSGFAGYQCVTRVLGTTVQDCWDEELLP